jgi:sulfoacetaldehyde dehydrogenase
MRQVDLVVVTGSQNNVRAAYSSGTPAMGVGAGNVAVIVDASADVADAAAKIRASKTFDNATSCSSENSVILVDAVYDEALAALEREGGVMLDHAEKSQLQQIMWPRGGPLSAAVIAQAAGEIAQRAGIARATDAAFLMVAEAGAGAAFPFSGEKLSPVLAVYRARDFTHAADIASRILAHEGAGHSIGIHTRDDAHVTQLALELQVCRVIVNQAHCFATGGNFDNGLPFSLSMGCGTWGRNSISDNLNYRHFLNITRIARVIPKNEPSEEDLFGAYRRAHGL